MSHGGRQVEQIEELWPRLIGRTCCATSEDRHAGKETDSREKLELKVIHACAHMIIADDALRVSVFSLCNMCGWICFP